MVLRSDQHSSRLHFPDRMISATMPIRHLHGCAAEGEPEELVAETNAKCRYSLSRDFANDCRSVAHCLRVTRTVGKKDAVGIGFERDLHWCISRHHRHSAIILAEQAQNVALDSVVIRDDVMPRARITPGV